MIPLYCNITLSNEHAFAVAFAFVLAFAFAFMAVASCHTHGSLQLRDEKSCTCMHIMNALYVKMRYTRSTGMAHQDKRTITNTNKTLEF